MTNVQVRNAVATDLSAIMAFNHSCQTEYVWQIDVIQEGGQIESIFREIRLPRSVSITYPRSISGLAETWSRRSGILVATTGGQLVGYIRTNDAIMPETAWVTDLVIASRYRRQGIATTLVLAAQSWAIQRNYGKTFLEMSSKNYPAIKLAKKLGYEFCGYNDKYYDTKDIALFFGRYIR
jgi:ribosomal protein S18 acetylase RimI-like enzyme